MSYIDEILNESIYQNEIIKLFYLSPVPSEELKVYTDEQLNIVGEKIIDILKAISIDNIISIIEANKAEIAEITSANIPQFSNINSIDDVLNVVESSDQITFELIGYYINKNASKGAQIKYGENHYKIAAAIGLTTLNKPFHVTTLGKEYMSLSSEDKISIRNKLFLLVPIVQKIIIDAKYKTVHPLDILRLYLSESTSIRRRSSVRIMVEYVYKDADMELLLEIKKNLDWK